jgi:hypothetical protein
MRLARFFSNFAPSLARKSVNNSTNLLPSNSPPALKGAFERVNRASEHLSEFKRWIEVWNADQAQAAVWNFDPKDSNHVIAGIKHVVPVPIRVGTLLGEICYNFRVALDYLVFELSYLDSGKPQNGTQFPIEDKKKGFRFRQERGWLLGLNAAHVAAIKALQPYNGCRWTKSLRNISNPDKHGGIVACSADQALKLTMSIGEPNATFESAPGTVSSATHPISGEKVYMKLHFTQQVQLRDGTPIVETLEEIHFQITKTIEAFKSEFK